MPPIRLKVVHSQLITRGAVRTPRRPLPDDHYWRNSLPSQALLRKIRRDGGCASAGAGARRTREPASEVGATRGVDIWGQLSARGADEARNVGARVERWFAERDDGSRARKGDADDDPEGSDLEGSDGEAAGADQKLAVAAIAPPDARSELTARAVISGLALPATARLTVDTRTGSLLRASAMPGGADVCAAIEGGGGFGEEDRQDAALDILELLGHSSDDAAHLLDAPWRDLLDITECAALYGLLPAGQLSAATRRALFRAPAQEAAALAAATLAAGGDGLGPLTPLLRTLLGPSVQAAAGLSRERLRVTVVPGFSMMCWAAALDLGRAANVWPAPSTGYLVETLVPEGAGADDGEKACVRIWQLRDAWEIRPSWHREPGPIPLGRLVEELGPCMSPSARAGPAGGEQAIPAAEQGS